ncbi:rhomboid family intramembrane serine protease [Microbacter margulisiae]|uniref:Membrane associated rhomboid family serine protease n=1 Tax=Microbacter margulisiae TaxID=1350067 RepID=A0A7W5H2I9_9PORP|nr:rhomboid family intramembrane serine protease [Microbacter margulisiae]MBB3187790.1 membrane associated rhomboid family serine protease [Microbacter margulisiae]
MLFSSAMSEDRRRFLHALVVPSLLSLVIFLVFVLGLGMGWDLDRFGVYPRTLQGVPGILLHPFVHAGWGHLGDNLPTFFILSTALYYFYHTQANRILLLIWVLTGIFLWCIGRESYHIGASSIIYGLAFFLFWGGAITPSISLTALSLVVVFWYGSMVWNMFPLMPHEMISWEGHLSGALAGSITAFVFRKSIVAQVGDKKNSLPDDDDDELTRLAMKYNLEQDEMREEEEEHNNDNPDDSRDNQEVKE